MFYKTTTFRLWLNLIVKSKNVSKLQFVNTERKIRLEQEIGARSQTPKIKPSIVNLQCVVYSFTCDLCDADYVGIHSPTPSSTHCRAQKSGNRSTFLIARLYALEYPPPPPAPGETTLPSVYMRNAWPSQSWPFFITNPHFPFFISTSYLFG